VTWLKFGTVKGGKTHRHIGGGNALCDPTIQFEVTGNLGEVSCKHCLRKMADESLAVPAVRTFFTYQQGLDYAVHTVTFPAEWVRPARGTWFKSLEGRMVAWHNFYDTPEEAHAAADLAKLRSHLAAFHSRTRDDAYGREMVQEMTELVEKIIAIAYPKPAAAPAI